MEQPKKLHNVPPSGKLTPESQMVVDFLDTTKLGDYRTRWKNNTVAGTVAVGGLWLWPLAARWKRHFTAE